MTTMRNYLGNRDLMSNEDNGLPDIKSEQETALPENTVTVSNEMPKYNVVVIVLV